MIYSDAWENRRAVWMMANVRHHINYFIGQFLSNLVLDYRYYLVELLLDEHQYRLRLRKILLEAKEYQAKLRVKKHLPKRFRRFLLEQYLRSDLSKLLAEKRLNDKRNRKLLLKFLAIARIDHYQVKSKCYKINGYYNLPRPQDWYPSLLRKQMRQYSRELSQMPKCKQRKADATARRKNMWKNKLLRFGKHRKQKKEVKDKDAVRRNARTYFERADDLLRTVLNGIFANNYRWGDTPVPTELEMTFTGQRGRWDALNTINRHNLFRRDFDFE